MLNKSFIYIFISMLAGFTTENMSTLDLSEGDSCINEDSGLKGVCIRLSSCVTTVLHDLRNKDYPPICSFMGLEPIVCCVSCKIIANVSEKAVVGMDGILFKTDGVLRSWDVCLDYTKNNSNSCRTRNFSLAKIHKNTCEDLIVVPALSVMGKSVKSRKEYPHIGLLGYGDDRRSAQWLCAGSVISDRYIITAAHCRAQSALGQVKYVALGILRRSDPASMWQHYDVEQFLPFPEYSFPSTYHDIALIHTDREIQFSETVLPICLAYKNPDGPTSDLGIVVGWGALGPSKPLADQLQEAVLSKYNDSECSALYPAHRRYLARGFDNHTQMCYGDRTGNHDTCQGDSGGPIQAYMLDRRYCTDFLIGITSNGRRCGPDNNAGVYTNILPYINWIEDIVWPRPRNNTDPFLMDF